MSMTSPKSFSTKNAGVLVVAVFSIAISIGISQVSSAMALDEFLNCKGVANGLMILTRRIKCRVIIRWAKYQRIRE